MDCSWPVYFTVSIPPKRIEPAEDLISSSHRLYAGVLMRPASTRASGRLTYDVPLPVKTLATEFAYPIPLLSLDTPGSGTHECIGLTRSQLKL